MKIKVKKEHIDKGERCSPLYCPIAEAMKSLEIETIHPEIISIRKTRAEFWTHDRGYLNLRLPEAAIEFIEQFDDEKTPDPEPFEFELPYNPKED